MPWEETVPAFAERLHEAVKHINANFGVRGLCMEFPSRLEALVGKTNGTVCQNEQTGTAVDLWRQKTPTASPQHA